MTFETTLADFRRDKQQLAAYLSEPAGTSEELKGLASVELYRHSSRSLLDYKENIESVDADIRTDVKALRNSMISGIYMTLDSLSGGINSPLRYSRVLSGNKTIYHHDNGAALSAIAGVLRQAHEDVRAATHNLELTVRDSRDAIHLASKVPESSTVTKVEKLYQAMDGPFSVLKEVAEPFKSPTLNLPAGTDYSSLSLVSSVKNEFHLYSAPVQIIALAVKEGPGVRRVYGEMLLGLVKVIENMHKAFEMAKKLDDTSNETLMANALFSAMRSVQREAIVFFEQSSGDSYRAGRSDRNAYENLEKLRNSVSEGSFDKYEEAQEPIKNSLTKLKEALKSIRDA